jgi:hypothetical protein
MKKIKLCLVGLSLSGMTYSQTLKPNQVTFDEYEVIEMINDIDEILSWYQEDELNGDYSHGSYEEMWGSEYWLTLMKEKLILKLNTRKNKNY